MSGTVSDMAGNVLMSKMKEAFDSCRNEGRRTFKLWEKEATHNAPYSILSEFIPSFVMLFIYGQGGSRKEREHFEIFT